VSRLFLVENEGLGKRVRAGRQLSVSTIPQKPAMAGLS